MAAPTRAQFLAAYPEFATLASDVSGQARVDEKLAMAVRRYDEGNCDPFYFDLVMLKTAQLLALSPFGQAARLSKKDTPATTYDALIEELELAVSFGNRVI